MTPTSTVVLLLLAAVVYWWLRRRKQSQQAIPQEHLPETFVVFDLETTGLKPQQDEIIEIAAIKFTRGTTTQETFQSLVKPSKAVPAKITELTGITQLMVDKEGGNLAEVIEGLREFVGPRRLVAFNADFDIAFLAAATAKLGVAPFDNPVSCALKMARRAWPGRQSYKLDDISKAVGIDAGTSHRALEDSRRALIVYAAATAQLQTHA